MICAAVELREQIAAIIDGMEGNVQFHDFQVVDCPDHSKLEFDVLVPYQYKMSDEQIREYIQSQVKKISASYEAVITIDKG